MRRMERVVWMALVVVLTVSVVLLSVFSGRFFDGGLCVVTLTTSRNDENAPVSSRRRYRTSDEMLYALYGVGDRQFTPYDQPLLDYVRALVSRPALDRPRQLSGTNTTDTSQVGQSAFVDRLLSGRRDGFFVECGAVDGEVKSNSLFFELKRNWTGLLIEANPDCHRALLDKNRRAYVLRACLAPDRRPSTARMQFAGRRGGIVDQMSPSHRAFISALNRPDVPVNCFPLNTIMAALNVVHVDYLSLDVEGPELEILRTVDWTRLRVDVVSVEYRVISRSGTDVERPATLRKLRDLRRFFRDTGIYREAGVLPSGNDTFGIDVVFSRI